MVYSSQSTSLGTESRFGSRTPPAELKQCCIEVCSSIIGLLTLFFFLAMGGMFALLGPWVILAGAQVVRKGPARQVWSFITGAGILSLSVMALLLPSHIGYWGTIGGLLGLLGELGCIVITLLRQVRQRRPESNNGLMIAIAKAER